MDYFSLGSEISYPDYNAMVYLLRKFKRLTSDLKLGSSTISSDYGTYSVTGGLTSVGGNFILEDDVLISSSDVLLNCFYTFYFTVVDVNLSGTVNRRVVSVTGDTGDNGVLEVTLSPDLLESDEVLLPDFRVDIVFDPHEYYTPVSGLNIELEVDKSYVSVGEVATVTATVLDDTGSAVSGLNLQFNINDAIVTDTTDSEGVASVNYTGTGNNLWINVSVSGENVRFYDGEILTAEFSGNNIKLGFLNIQWLYSTGDVIIDWGDGTEDIVNNPKPELTHSYSDGLSSHDIKFIGIVTGLGEYCFNNCTGLVSAIIPNTVTSIGIGCFHGCTNLTSIVIPNSVTSLKEYCFYNCRSLSSITIPSSVTSLGESCFDGCRSLTSVTIPEGVRSLGFGCFWDCTSLTSVTIPNSVTNLGNYCFASCTNLVEYQLYWTNFNIIAYNQYKMPNNAGTHFFVPSGQKNIYTNAMNHYPADKVVERGVSTKTLTLTCPTDPYADGSTYLSGEFLDGATPLGGETVEVYEGSNLLGTATTEDDGYYSITIPANTFNAGQHTLKAVSGEIESENLILNVRTGYAMDISCNTPIIQSGDSATVVARITRGGEGIGSFKSVHYVIKHGSTVIKDGGTSTDQEGKIEIYYTGTGVGDVTFEVSYTDTYEGIILQETYEIIDGWFYDDGVSGTASYLNIRSTKTVDSTGTLVTATGQYAHMIFVNSAKRFDLPFKLEFDLISTSNGSRIDLYDDSTESFVDIIRTGHVVIEVRNGTITATCDGTPLTVSQNKPVAPSRISFMLNGTSDSLKFKNAVVYSI